MYGQTTAAAMTRRLQLNVAKDVAWWNALQAQGATVADNHASFGKNPS